MLSHPYYKASCIAVGRTLLRFIRSPGIQKTVPEELFVSRSGSDEDVFEFVKARSDRSGMRAVRSGWVKRVILRRV